MYFNITFKERHRLLYFSLLKTGILLFAMFLVTQSRTLSMAGSPDPIQTRPLQKTSSQSDILENLATFLGSDGTWKEGIRCGAPSPTREEAESARKALDSFNLQKREGRETALIISVVFHVVRHSDGSADVTDLQISKQMDVLNNSYIAVGYQFTLQSVNRVNNTIWSTDPSLQSETAMKRNLAVNPASTLNIYTCDLSNGLLGYSYLPYSYNENSFMHGVVVLYSSLPGGTAYPYNEGDSVTHEVGHYLGLYHTFENKCFLPGDEVDDTPYEESPASGCPLGRDSCPRDPGEDPIHNFMDYSDDACMEEFTVEQGTRMDAMVAAYKPTLWNSNSVFPDIKANGSDGPVSVLSTDPVKITVTLYPGNQAGQNADWWIGVLTSLPAPNDWFTYVYPDGWKQGIHLYARTPLFELNPPLEVLDNSLPAGNYTFYFVIDALADGSANSVWYDSLEVTVK